MLPFLVLKGKDAAGLCASVPVVWGKVRGILRINSISPWPAHPGRASLAPAELCFISLPISGGWGDSEQLASLEANVQGGRNRR